VVAVELLPEAQWKSSSKVLPGAAAAAAAVGGGAEDDSPPSSPADGAAGAAGADVQPVEMFSVSLLESRAQGIVLQDHQLG
jgi:hypothetical protein